MDNLQIEIKTLSEDPAAVFKKANLITRKKIFKGHAGYSIRQWLEAFEKEHSTLRTCWFLIILYDVPRSVAAQLRTHSSYGTYSWMSSSRPDLTKETREENEAKGKYMLIMINPLGWIDLCRKRMCTKAERETREVVDMITSQMCISDSSFFEALFLISTPDCGYRKFCPYNKDCFGYLKELKNV